MRKGPTRMHNLTVKEAVEIVRIMRWGYPVRATLLKKAVSDGLYSMLDDVPVGHLYDVYPGSRRRLGVVRGDRPRREPGSVVMRESIFAISSKFGAGWLPVELLRIEDAKAA